MNTKTILVSLAAAFIIASSATSADAKRAKHHHPAKNPAKSARVQSHAIAGFHREPARMIEIKPGLWISSYGCITDDGYGRFLPCDMPDNGR